MTSNQKHTTELGTPEMHSQHSVMIEGGTLPRAKVMDQALVDRYLMDGLLTLEEHQAAEYLMNQASQAGIYTKPLNFESGGGARTSDPFANDGLQRFGKTLRLLTDKYGEYHKYIVQEVVLHNWDVSENDRRMGILKEGLSWISYRRMSGGKNPLRHITQKKSHAV